MQGIRSSALAVVLACSAATTNAAHLTKDPLTQLPLPTITDNAFGNDPTEMPAATICKSQFRGNFYSLSGASLDSAVSWYISTLKGFRHIQSADHAVHAFADAQRSVIVILMGKPGGAANTVAYEKYEPGLSEKTLQGIAKNSLDCTG
jgi:hypothetical protein